MLDRPSAGSYLAARSRRRRSAALVIAVLANVAIIWPADSRAQEQQAVGRGEELYAANCAMCHGADAGGMMGMHPALGGVIDRLSREGVEVTVRNGRNTMPPMPAFGDRLTDEEIADIIAYLGSLPPGPRNFGPESTLGDGMPGGMMDRMEDMMGGSCGGLADLLTALAALLAILIAAGVIVAVVAGRRKTPAPPGQSAREILDRRYAAGALSVEEYRQRRTDLES